MRKSRHRTVLAAALVTPLLALGAATPAHAASGPPPLPTSCAEYPGYEGLIGVGHWGMAVARYNTLIGDASSGSDVWCLYQGELDQWYYYDEEQVHVYTPGYVFKAHYLVVNDHLVMQGEYL
jgi:hypothetical protein